MPVRLPRAALIAAAALPALLVAATAHAHSGRRLSEPVRRLPIGRRCRARPVSGACAGDWLLHAREILRTVMFHVAGKAIVVGHEACQGAG